MNWKLIFNPFSIYSEKQLLVAGILITLAGSLLGAALNISFDGVLDIHQNETDFVTSLKENSINVASMFTVLFITGKLINGKTRAVDILNTSTVARFSMYIGGVITAMPLLTRIGGEIIKHQDDLQHLNINPLDLALLFAISMLLLTITAYYIVLLVNGFKTSTNAKKWQHFVAFAVALIIAEIISKLLISL
ncbi:YIP1 family protein [uncultured Chryseobacterium sp.]|uniref:YIP1 family protein n=1 Tax=uncultured Chryseobacterium sp. TaxID=259322 RepID=UPI0025D32E3E|nr:YIP1 family protein [uncultured Chryseobacterium sp.]